MLVLIFKHANHLWHAVAQCGGWRQASLGELTLSQDKLMDVETFQEKLS